MLKTYWALNTSPQGIVNETAIERRVPVTYENAKVDQWQPGDVVVDKRKFGVGDKYDSLPRGIIVWAITDSGGHQELGILWSEFTSFDMLFAVNDDTDSYKFAHMVA